MFQTIPLGKLVASPRNVRRHGDPVADAQLKASIAAHGLLQNLVVRAAPKGRFEVEAGGRRRRAMLALLDDKVLPRDHQVTSLVLSADNETAPEASLAENFHRLAMNPADEAQAFAALIEGGANSSLLDGKLTGTLAVFQMDKTNVLATDTVNIGFLVAIGKVRSRGAEVDLTGRLPGNLELRLSYAYVDAEARSAVIDPNSVQIASGDSLLTIPRRTVNVQLARDMAIGAVTGRIGIGLQHVGTRLGETGTAFMLPSHTLVRLFARANLTKNIEVFGEVQNLFNRRWFANSYSTLWLQPGAPRAASIGVRTRF